MDAEIIQVLASAVQFLPVGVVLTEADPASPHKVIFANQAFERLSGYSFDELKEKGLALLQGEKTDHAVLERLLESSEEAGEPRDVLLYKKDGTPFWDRVSLSPRRIANALYYIQVHSDVTQQKATEEGFILAQKREVAGHLVSGLAHDFNNLLTAIMVYCGLADSKQGDAQLHHYLKEIHGSAERGAQLVAQLLNLGREDAAEPEMVNLRDLVDEMCDLLKRVLEEDIRLTVQSDADLWKVRVHPGRIKQVLLNLAINSRHAMPRGGDFVIQLLNHELRACPTFPDALPGRYVLLIVSDTGVGMDNQTLANLFKPFFSTKEKGQGTGLGLLMVRTIFGQYGGRIHVSSNPGQGTTFKILLPAAPETGPTSGGRATVLLVEDDDVVRRSLDATLSLRGYEVLVASTADEALKLSLTHKGEVQLLLTDLVMPSVNGADLAREIERIRPGIKVLFMSGYGNDPRRSGTQLEGTLNQASNFIKKPFTPALLVEKIEELLRQ